MIIKQIIEYLFFGGMFWGIIITIGVLLFWIALIYIILYVTNKHGKE